MASGGDDGAALRGLGDSLRGSRDSLRSPGDSLRGSGDSLRGSGDSLRASLLSCLVALDPSTAHTLDDRVLQLYALRTAEMRRRRARETEARARRLRHYLRRRKAVIVSAVAGVFNIMNSKNREIWSRDRPQEGGDFWQSAQLFSDDEWKRQFRVSRLSFGRLLQLLESSISRKKTHIRAPIDARRRLAIALWWYGQGEEYKRIAERFGVGVTTVCIILRQVTAAIVNTLFKTFVVWPSGEKLDAAVRAFRDMGYPQCAGAIGATHIPIAGPGENTQDYMNTNGWYSVILQAVVDHKLCFSHVYAGWPGSTSNSTVLCSSDLYLKAEDQLQGALFPPEKSVVVGGVQIPVHLIGDSSFPLKPWLLTGYDLTSDLSPEQRRFSFSLNSARSVVDSAFSRLKARWRCLHKRKDIEVTAMPGLVSACCVLHNVCQSLGDEWSEEAAGRASDVFPQPDVEPCEAEGYGAAAVIRHTVAYNFVEIQQQPSAMQGFSFT